MRILTDIDKDGDRTTQNERVRSRRARLGWQDNFVAALDIQQQRGEVQRRRACMSEQSLAAARSNRALALVISEAIFIRNPAVLRPETWRLSGGRRARLHFKPSFNAAVGRIGRYCHAIMRDSNRIKRRSLRGQAR